MPEGFAGDRTAARAAMRAQRGAIHGAGWGQVLQDWYVGLFTAATLLTMVFAGTGGAILTPDCADSTCLSSGGYQAVAAGLAVSGVLALALLLRLAGPASGDSARAVWLLAAPADRAVLLRGPLLRMLALGSLVGGVWGLLVGIAAAGGVGDPAVAIGSVVLIGVVGLLVGALLVHLTLWRQGGSLAPASAARGVRDAELARAGQVVGAVTAATIMLDSTALDVLATRSRLARRGRFASRPGAGGALMGVLVHEMRALRRCSGRVILSSGTCVVALVAGVLLGRLIGVLVASAATFLIARAAAGGLRAWLGSPGLRRAVPTPPEAVAAVLALPALVVSVVAAMLSLLGLGLPWWGGVLLGCGALAGVVRSCDPLPPELGLVLTSPVGAIPTGLIMRFVHGPDLALGAGLVLLAAHALELGLVMVLLGPALLAWQLMRPRD